MGKPDIVLKAYMKKPERIRSVLEYFYGGKLPQDWAIEAADGFYSIKDSKGKISFRERDNIRRISAKGFSFYLGLENQDSIDLIYPWRVMELDCCVYGKEITEIQERNKAIDIAYGAGDDFKYRYRKSDKLKPVLTLTLYWGRQEWEKPLTVAEMSDMGGIPEKLQGQFADYKVHLISMRSIPEEELEKMDSDLKYVLGIMKHSSSRKQYTEYIWKNREYFRRIPKSAVDVINVCTNIKEIRNYLKFIENPQEGEETADMCKALEDFKKAAEKKGIKQGVQQGIGQMNKLTRLLLADGRQEDLLKSTTDAIFQEKLFKEYNIL